MVRFFSAAWLAQSHHTDLDSDPHPPCRPHVPCMVQPRPPTYGKGYLQPKPRQASPDQLTEPTRDKESSVHSPCTSPVSEITEYSSGYESEAELAECLSSDEVTEVQKEGVQRRIRTKFTAEQISKLEKIFSKHKYLDPGERGKMAQKLKLSQTQVRTWFQNRRMKLKREMQDYLTPQAPPVLLQPLAPGQYHSGPGPRPPYPAFFPVPPTLLPPVPHPVLQHHMLPHHPQHLMIHNPHFY